MRSSRSCCDMMTSSIRRVAGSFFLHISPLFLCAFLVCDQVAPPSLVSDQAWSDPPASLPLLVNGRYILMGHRREEHPRKKLEGQNPAEVQ